jgi:hypothetical protein
MTGRCPATRGRDCRGGRGRSGRTFCGGCGRERFQGRGRSTTSEQLDIKVFPHGIERDTQTVACDTVKDHIEKHAQNTYKHGQDTAASLRDLEKKDLSSLMPKRGQSAETDPAANENKQAGMDTMCQAELKRCLEQKDALEQNLTVTI